jgi:hypothetical protein
MSRRPALLASTLACAVASFGAAPARAATMWLRVLSLGDSVAWGEKISTGWRGELWSTLAAAAL